MSFVLGIAGLGGFARPLVLRRGVDPVTSSIGATV